MTVLVTGGAGYIGSHVVRAFRLAGIDCVVVDDFSSGHRAFVPDDVVLLDDTILDTEVMAKAMVEHRVEAVVHLAGFKYAGVSVRRPLHTYEQNVQGTVSLLQAMRERRRQDCLLLQRCRLRDTGCRDRHRADSDLTRIAVRREQADW